MSLLPWFKSQEVQCETGVFIDGARATIDSKEACEGCWVDSCYSRWPLGDTRIMMATRGVRSGYLQLVTQKAIIQNTNDPIARTVRPYSLTLQSKHSLSPGRSRRICSRFAAKPIPSPLHAKGNPHHRSLRNSHQISPFLDRKLTPSADTTEPRYLTTQPHSLPTSTVHYPTHILRPVRPPSWLWERPSSTQ